MRILVIEDNRDILANVLDYLELKGYVVDCAQDGLSGLHLAATQDYDLIVLDLMLPGEDGLSICRRMRQAENDMPIIMLTARGEEADKVRGLDAGADDYVLKPFNLQELLARLRVVMRRSEGRTSQILALGALTIDEVLHAVSWRGKDVKLGRREYALLLELARHPDRVLSRPRLENLLYGWDGEVDSNALEVHIHHLRKKLLQENKHQLNLYINTIQHYYALRPLTRWY